MGKINLTDQEIATVVESISQGTEIPPDLLKKLSPSFFEKLSEEVELDVQKLDRFKIPTIEYAGKRPETQILTHAALMGGNAPLEIVRCFEGGKETKQHQLELFEQAQESDQYDGNWKNLIVQGDNLQFLKTCYLNQNPLIKDKVKGKVKLIYIDPPFATRGDFGGNEGESSYSDKIDRAEFLESLRERLIFMREILADDGSIFLHIDQKMNHYVKIVMDEIFNKSNFINEVIWHYYNIAPSSKQQFAKNHDTILWYAKQRGAQTFNLEKLRIPYSPGSAYAKKGWSKDSKYNPNPKGKLRDDVWRIPTINNMAKERTGYPTQKPEKLIKIFIDGCTKPGDLIIDMFAGSGTTAAVAEKLGRRWIMCDFGKHAIYTMQKRMLEIGGSKALGENADGKYGKPTKPFCVVSVGAYDFSKIMDLRENKDIYIQFVCGLFNINEIDQKLSEKYHVSNIYAEKENDPVEIYPVWDDEYLKEVKIDQDYLQGIIDQSGGKLLGDYYIITPETCTTIGNTEMVNAKNEKVTFHILSFPYKVLEEFVRQQKLQEQPSSEGDINNLISSVGFYFNEHVEVDITLTKKGLSITHFETDALDSKGQKFEGLDGLAMVLIDRDYDGEVFKMEEAVYAKDIDEQGDFEIDDLTDKVAVVVIDKHGNESELKVLEG